MVCACAVFAPGSRNNAAASRHAARRPTRARPKGRSREGGGGGRRPCPPGRRSGGRHAEDAEGSRGPPENAPGTAPDAVMRWRLALWRSALWRSGALALWRSGALALWRSGALALWRSGALALWRSGALALIVGRIGVSAVKSFSRHAIGRPLWTGNAERTRAPHGSRRCDTRVRDRPASAAFVTGPLFNLPTDRGRPVSRPPRTLVRKEA